MPSDKVPLTDTDRLDFLSRQKFTRWVGYDISGDNYDGEVVWPVFGGMDFRAEVDRAMKECNSEPAQSSESGTMKTDSPT